MPSTRKQPHWGLTLLLLVCLLSGCGFRPARALRLDWRLHEAAFPEMLHEEEATQKEAERAESPDEEPVKDEDALLLALGEDLENDEEEPVSPRPWSPAQSTSEETVGDTEPDPLDEDWSAWHEDGNYGPFGAVPIGVDYFQGFLLYAGIPSEALPGDNRRLRPEEALALVPHLLTTPITLANYGPRRMAMHLLREVAEGGVVVQRSELHERMRRFLRLLVLRPDGYLVEPYTGRAVQKAGTVEWVGGRLRAGRFEVGPFYAIEGQRLYPVDESLQVSATARPAGLYEPDRGKWIEPVVEGASLAVVDTVEGLVQLVVQPDQVLEGLAQLPEAVATLVEQSPEFREQFEALPYAEKVRQLSRLTTTVLLVVGSGGAGSVRAASVGGRVGALTLPVLTWAGREQVAVQLVQVAKAGKVVTGLGQASVATYVLNMANMGAQGGKAAAGRGSMANAAMRGPGQWIQKTESMSPISRRYQAQVTRAPKNLVYRVTRNGRKADFDDFMDAALVDAKGPGYERFFMDNLEPKSWFRGAKKLVRQARRQLEVANGTPIRWIVAESKTAAAFQKLLESAGVKGIEIIVVAMVP